MGCEKGFKAVLGIACMKGKGCFSQPQEENRKMGCQFKEKDHQGTQGGIGDSPCSRHIQWQEHGLRSSGG